MSINVSELGDIAGRFDISESEAARIAERANSEAEFVAIWENEDDWTDNNNPAARLPVYVVVACAESGEWSGEPVRTSETSTMDDWHAMQDTDAAHFDTYEHFEKDDLGRSSLDSETRLIRVELTD